MKKITITLYMILLSLVVNAQKFAVIGDYGVDNEFQLKVANLVKSLNPEFIITSGDNNYYDGEASTIDQNIGKYYGDYIFPYSGAYGSTATQNNFFPSPGNHDYDNDDEDAAPYYDYFTLPGNERYYDFIRGDVHFFALNSNREEPDLIDVDGTQALWLKDKLANSTAKWKIVYMHHPPYTSGVYSGRSELRWPYAEWGATSVITGHNHIYERLTYDNIPYFVNGTGGRSLYTSNNPLRPETQFWTDEHHGAMLVEATAQSITFEFWSTDNSGTLLDTFTVGTEIVLGPDLPVITLNGSSTVNLNVDSTYVELGATAQDLIDGDISGDLDIDSSEVDTSSEGTYTVYYNVTDSDGNDAVQVTRTVNVANSSSDTTNPVITLNGLNPMNLNVFSPYIEPGATANDNFDGDITARIAYTGTVNFNVIGSYNVFYNVSDNAGNPAPQVTRTVNVGDFAPPTITLTGGSTISLPFGSVFNNQSATANDNIDGDVSSNITTRGEVNTTAAGTYTINYNVSDAAGNAASQVNQTVTVLPLSSPPINETTIIADIIVDSDDVEENETDGTMYDGSSDLELGFDGYDNQNFQTVGLRYQNLNIPKGTVIVNAHLEFTVKDANNGDCNLLISGEKTGNSLPYTSDPYNLTNETVRTKTTNTVSWSPADWSNLGAKKNSPDLTSIIQEIIDENSWEQGNAISMFIKGSLGTRYASSFEGSSGPAPKLFITYRDINPPVITLNGDNPMNLTVGTPYTEPGAIATDDIDGVSNLNPSDITGTVNVNSVGTYLVNYNTTDAAGNAATQVTRTVNVTAAADTTPPVITLNGDNPMNLTVGTPYTEPGATVNDNVDGLSNLDPSGITGTVDFNVVGTYFINYNTTDAANNPADQVTRTVNVTPAPDTTPPVITLNGDNPLTLTVGSTYIEPGAIVTDNVDGVSNISPGGILGNVNTNIVGNYLVSYNTIDAAGNPAVQVLRDVIVTAAADTTPPVITLIGDNPMTLTVGTPYIELGATVNDNIDGPSNLDPTGITGNVNFNVIGSYFVTYNTNDAAGNPAAQVTRTVNVTAAPDTTPPVITLNGDNPMSLPLGTPYTEPGATVNDNIDGPSNLDPSGITGTVDFNTVGTYFVNYNTTDAAGNPAAQITRTVNVTAAPDTTPPVITLNGDNPMNLTVGTPYTEPGATVNDNVDGASNISPTGITGTVDFNTVGTYFINYNTNDAAGNPADQVTRTVNVTAANGVQTSYINPIAQIPGLIEGEYYDQGGQDIAYNDDGIRRGTRSFRPLDNVDVAAHPQGSNGYIVGYGETGEWLEYTVDVLTENYDITLYYFSGDTPGDLQISLDGSVVSTISGMKNGDWSIQQTITATNVALTGGNAKILRLEYVNGARFDIDAIDFKVATPAPPTNLSITLLGDNPINLDVGDTYIEQGATASDNQNNDYSPDIVITGTVDTNIAGTYTVYYNVTDNEGNTANEVTRTIIVSTPIIGTQTPYLNPIAQIPGLIEGEYYDQGGQGVAYNDDGIRRGDKTFRPLDNVDVAAHPQGSNGYIVGYGATGEWLEYTVDVTPGNYDITLYYFSGHKPGELQISLDGTVVSTISGMVNGNWSIQKSITIKDVPLTGGNAKTLRLEYVNGSRFDIDAIDFQVATPTPPTNLTITLLGDNPVNIDVDENYMDQGATASDDLNADYTSDIVITGNVDTSTAGTYTLYYNVTDNDGNTANEVTRTIIVNTPTPEIQAPNINSQALIPGIIEGEYYDQGGQGIAYNDDNTKSGERNFRPQDNVDVAAHNQASNGYIVGYGATGEWLEYTVDVTPGNYDITLYYFSGHQPGELQISLDGTEVCIIDGLENGNWDIQKSITVTDVALTGGNAKILRLEYLNGARFDIDAIEFKVATGPMPSKSSKSSSTNTTEDALKESSEAEEKKVTIYPNPVSKTLYIDFTDTDTLKQIRVYSLNGQLLYSDEVNTQSTSIPIKEIGATGSTVTVLIEFGSHKSSHRIILQ